MNTHSHDVSSGVRVGSPWFRRASVIAALAGLAMVSPAWADDDECLVPAPGPAPSKAIPGFDAANGRDTRTFAPDRVVDFTHMKLAIDIPDMNRPHFSAAQTLTFAPISKKLAELTLDAHLLDVKSVVCPNFKTSFTSDGKTMTVNFDPPVPAGTRVDLTTAYEVDDPPQGITWTPESPAWPGRPAQLHSQGESDTNSYWFPCHDFPNERLATELIVTVPDGYTVSSNGREAEPPAKKGGRTTFHWLQSKPHVNYLVSLVVGKFDVVDVSPAARPVQATGSTPVAFPAGHPPVPMPVYAPKGRGGDVQHTYERTPQMVALFERLTGHAYPWDRYAQVIVWNFGAGGMENTSATTMYDTAILALGAEADGDLDGLISHELAHQWFGDLITCKSWDHIWLNEGFATYFTQLWMEEHAGHFGTSNDAYQAGILGNFDAVTDRDKTDAPFQAATVSKAYTNPGESFGRAGNPYPKGSSVLHMLRTRLGDEVFFRGIAAWVERYQLQTAETSDFRRVMEEVSGEPLEQFFNQWLFRPGVPELEISTSWDAEKRELTVACEQKQHISGYNPAFAFDLPIWVETGSAPGVPASGPLSRGRLLTLPVRENSATQTFALDAEPGMVVIDPQLAVLSKQAIKQPLKNWIAQVERGPTFAARAQAARTLAFDDSAVARTSLLHVAQEAGAHPKLRSIAIESLRKRHDTDALADLAGRAAQLPPDARVTLMEQIASIAADKETDAPHKARFTDFLAASAGNDTSARTRAAALKGLGTLKASDTLQIILAAAELESQHDRIRQGALEALGDLDAKEGLPTAIRYSLPGAYNRTRPIAIAAVAKLAHHDPESAYKALSMVLPDRERRAWEAAGEAMVKLRDARAAGEFENLASAKRDETDKKKIAGWEEQLTKQAAR
jgi:aminopeptidase N